MRYSSFTLTGSQMTPAITCGMLIIFGCHSVTAQPKQTVPSVKLDIGSIAPGDGVGQEDEPLLLLSVALRQHPKTRFFRLNWEFSMGSFGSLSTALYDRLKHTLRFYYGYGHNAAGNIDDHGGSHLLFTGVTESVIDRAAEAHAKDVGAQPDGYISDLTRFGCVSHVLRSPTPKPR